jgi:hypothetical protein
VVVEGAGYSVALEAADEVNRILAEHVAAVGAAARTSA